MTSYDADLKQLFSDSGLVFLSEVVSMGAAFIAHTLLVRNLDPDLFGVFSLAVTIISVTAGFALVGMGQTVTRFISASDPSDAPQYLTIGLGVVTVSGSVLALGLYAGGSFLESFFDSPDLNRFLQVLALLVVFRPIAGVIVGTVRGLERTRWKVFSNDIVPFTLSIIMLGVFFYLGEILIGALLFYLVRPLLQIVLLTGNLLQWQEWQFELGVPDRSKFTDMASFAWPLSFQGLVVLFMGNLDILMLGWLSTSSEVGYYRSIQPVAQILLFLLGSLTFIYLPIATRYFTDGEYDKLDSIYKTATRWVAHATFPLFLFYLLFGKEFITVMFTEEYSVAWSALAILSIGIYTRVFVGPNGMTIKAIDRTKEDLLASISSIITNAVLNLTLIPQFGISGAAIATTASFIVYNVVELSLIYKYAGVSPFHWDLVTPLVPTTLIMMILVVAGDFRPTSLPVLFLVGLGICVIHLISVGVVTGLRPEDQLLLDQFRSE